MMTIQELHTKAMEMADRADDLKRQGIIDEAEQLYRQAMDNERSAALMARDQHTGEPTESVLLRSAASLAYCAHDYREAERLVCLALSGNPPGEIADELRSLFDSISMERNMAQMSIGSSSNEQENITITLPIKERNLLHVLVRKFGWACVF